MANLSEKYGFDEKYDLDREKLLLELMKYKHENEKRRFYELDNKSSNLIAFLGVMLTLQSYFGVFIFADMKTGGLGILTLIFFAFSILFYGVAIFCFIKSYNLMGSESPMDQNQLIDEYGINDFPQETIVIETTDNFRNSINHNEKLMKNKGKAMKKGFRFLELGVLFTTIFIMSLLIFNIGG